MEEIAPAHCHAFLRDTDGLLDAGSCGRAAPHVILTGRQTLAVVGVPPSARVSGCVAIKRAWDEAATRTVDV